MDILRKYFFLTLAFFPFLQFLFIELIGKEFVFLYAGTGTILFLLYLFSGVKFKYPKYILPLVLITVYYFIWDLVNKKITIDSNWLSYYLENIWLHTISFLILVENTQFDEKFINRIIRIFKATIVIAFIVSIIQLIVDPLFFTPEKYKIAFQNKGFYEIRLNSIFGYLSPTEVGDSFIPIISILIGYYLYRQENFNPIWLFMAGLTFFANKSRYLYLNFIIILIQYPLVNGIQIQKLRKIITIGLVSIVVTFFFLKIIGFDLDIFIKERLLSETASTRFLALEMFTRFFPENPFFGSGVHVGEDLRRAIAERSSQIHVGYLSHLYEFGIVGTFVLFSFYYLVLKKFYLLAKQTNYYGSFFVIITVLVTNITGVRFEIYFYGLLFAFIFNKFINDQYDEINS